MWDPSVLWHEGRYYAFMMFNKEGGSGLKAGHCLLAVSEDGVHWQDEAVVIEEREIERGCKFFKCFVGRCGDRFIMDHGVARPEGQDTLRFYESKDLKNWSYLFSSTPDPEWYVPTGRWDHMYVLPKEEGNPAAGFWGHPVSTPKPELPRGVGMTQSPDGLKWEVLPPAKVEWGDVPPKDFEWGGCERFGGKYYLIGGTGGHKDPNGFMVEGYSMYVFTADDPRGPFRPDADAYRLCGSTNESISWLAVWCRCNGEILISNYASMETGSRSPWMLPLRKPLVDSKEHLRLGWWPGNECLKDTPITLSESSMMMYSGALDISWLENTFDLEKGVIIEGTVKANAASVKNAVAEGDNGSAAGFVFKEESVNSTAILLGIGEPEDSNRETHVGGLSENTASDDAAGPGDTGESPRGYKFTTLDVTGKHCASVTGIVDDKQHSFRLLARMGGFELYIDNLLVQMYIYKPAGGKIGMLVRNAEVVFDDLKAWSMSL